MPPLELFDIMFTRAKNRLVSKRDGFWRWRRLRQRERFQPIRRRQFAIKQEEMRKVFRERAKTRLLDDAQEGVRGGLVA